MVGRQAGGSLLGQIRGQGLGFGESLSLSILAIQQDVGSLQHSPSYLSYNCSHLNVCCVNFPLSSEQHLEAQRIEEHCVLLGY